MTADRVIYKNSLATADLEDLADYYRREAGLTFALRFVDQTELAFEQLAAMPLIGPVVGLDELPYEDIRRWHISGFDRLIIFYRPTADGIEVIRVLHTARDLAALIRRGLLT